jgi:hypothetical protein
MALNLDAVGKKIGPNTKAYTWRDTVMYALGVGAGFNDLVSALSQCTILCPNW